jgi:small subunit ribosomal protein S1
MMCDTGPWERDLGEAYWQALLTQGEISPAVMSLPDSRPPPPWSAPLVPADDSTQPAVAPAYGSEATRRGEDAFWAELTCAYATGRVFTAPVIGCNKGGLLVRVNDGIAFVPASQLADLPASLGTSELPIDLEAMVGRTLRLRLIELDRARNRVICSERATTWSDGAIDGRLDQLEGCIGSETVGAVRSICDFGVFVDLGGLDGLIHISELSWRRVHHPGEVLQAGDEVRVMVLHVDRASRRVALSLKRLDPDPWLVVGECHAVGDVIDAVITTVVPFGAFAQVDEGVEGLIHLSELADGPFLDPRQVVSEGQRVRVRVLHVDSEARRLGLSLRQVRGG